jgi:hypothetical protein
MVYENDAGTAIALKSLILGTSTVFDPDKTILIANELKSLNCPDNPELYEMALFGTPFVPGANVNSA